MSVFDPVKDFLAPFTAGLSGYICLTRAFRSDIDAEANKGWSDSHNYYCQVVDGETVVIGIEHDLVEHPEYAQWEWYFTPAVFSRPRRRLEDFQASNALWLDFDQSTEWGVFDPAPSFVVQSRPGDISFPDRCQAFWLLDEPLTDQFKLRHLNRTIFQYFGCDDESCVTPQHLMKLPFGRNLKLSAQLSDNSYWAPKLISATGELHGLDSFESMPEPPENSALLASGAVVVPDTLPDIQGKTWGQWLSEHSGRIPFGIRQRIETASLGNELTRSENLYGIIASLLDFLTPDNIFRVICGSPNDKFTGKHGPVRGPVYLWQDIHRIWDKVSTGKPDSGLILSNEFWESRNSLKTIRQAAHARGTSADTVLACTLARLSALVDYKITVNAGLGPSTLNMFVILLGATGVGKGRSMKVAKEILKTPLNLTINSAGLIDGIGVGSGEGIAEAYMGKGTEETPNGKPKEVRKQVRNNAFLTADEGKAFATLAARKGSILADTICSAWSGSDLGQANASEERTRFIPEGSYALGLAIGFQEATVMPVLEQEASGLPQRFLWLSCIDTNRPEHPIDPPMLPLGGVLTSVPNDTITFADSICQEIWQYDYQKGTGKIIVPEERSQETLMLMKVAGLLCLLDGRSHVDTDDWDLAKEVWETSLRVMDSAKAYHRTAAARKSYEERQQAVSLEAVKEVTRKTAMDNLEKAAKILARAVRNHEEKRLTKGVLRSRLNSKTQRHLFDQAIEHAINSNWLNETESGAYTPGSVNPE